MVFEQQREHFRISTDKTRLDIAAIYDFLTHSSYWAQGRTRAVVERSIANSLCFGVYDDTQQVGFARVVTDTVTFAWLADVFILPSHRGRGLGKWLVECVLAHPDLQGLRTFMLATRDAQGLYAQYGFKPVEDANRWMVKRGNPPSPPTSV